MGERWLCAWCGAELEPLQTGWTDLGTGSGEYCPEGQAVRDWGSSPHLPVRAAAESGVASSAPLDAVRLAEAIDAAWDDGGDALDDVVLIAGGRDRGYHQLRPAPDLASRIAAEYERLAPEGPTRG